MRTVHFWVNIQQIVIISYWRLRTTYWYHLQASIQKRKPVAIAQNLYSEEGGSDKFLVALCQPIGLMQVDGREGGSIVISMMITIPPSHPGYWELISTHLPYLNSVPGRVAFFLDSGHLKMGLIGCPEMSVRNYRFLLLNNPEEFSSHLGTTLTN